MQAEIRPLLNRNGKKRRRRRLRRLAQDDNTQAGYDEWRANFGTSLGSGSGAALPSAEVLSAAVPEPATLTLLIMAMVVNYARRCSTVPLFQNSSTRRFLILIYSAGNSYVLSE